MKKKALLALLFIVPSLLGTASCSNEDEETTTETTTETTVTTTETTEATMKGKIDDYDYGLSFTLSEDNTYYSVSKIDNIEVKDITIPKTYMGLPVKEIVDNAFCNCSSLTSIEIPEGVESIGDSAFYGCSSLKEIEIPVSCTIIDEYAFAYCSGLASVTLPNSINTLGEAVFLSCSSLLSITIPEGVASIGFCTFCDCSSLSSIQIPKGLKKIEDYAFCDCSSLTSIEIPSRVVSIGEDAFFGCYKLVEVYNLSTRSLTIGSEDNGYLAYYAKVIHTSLDEESVVVIDDNGYAFAYLDNKGYLLGYTGADTELTLPESFTYNGNTINEYGIYEYAFYDCTSLTSVKMVEGVTSIGYMAFLACDSITSITIPNSVTSIGGWALPSGENLEYNIYKNGKYLGNDENPYCVFIKMVDKEASTVELNSNTKIILDYAFSHCDSLTSIDIPNSVKSIGESAFDRCVSLTSIDIPNSVKSIGRWAFYNCSSLTSITLPDSVTSIEEYTFSRCYNLTSIIIPDSVKAIDAYAFKDYILLKVYYLGTSPYTATITTIGENNNSLTDATWYYFTENGENEAEVGNWWYYDTDGVTIIEKIVE